MNSLWDVQTYFITLYPLYMSFIWIIGGLLFYFRWERKPRPPLKTFPPFSIVIAAHDEEGSIEGVVRTLSQMRYPDYEVIVVNDGSTDGTRRILDSLVGHYDWLKVVHLHPNSGKSKAINTGILCSRGEYILVMDADCFLDKNAMEMMAYHFVNYPRVGAVTGNPRIINRTSLLGKIQVGEYSSIIGLIKRTQRILGKVLTVSGVIAAYRRSALLDCGLFDSDTLTEDIDITWKLQKRMWQVRYEPRALCFILSPETVAGLWKQRVRWAQGGISVMKKHCDIWLSWRQRRFWPVYVEYITGMFWSFCVSNFVICLLFGYSLALWKGAPLPENLVPSWTGSLLGVICLFQFSVSFFIDSRYESKHLLKYYLWIIWYPLFYWFIGALATYAGFFNVFIRQGSGGVTWKSPDRGLHTLKS